MPRKKTVSRKAQQKNTQPSNGTPEPEAPSREALIQQLTEQDQQQLREFQEKLHALQQEYGYRLEVRQTIVAVPIQ